MNRFVQDKVNPPLARTFSIDTKGEITCLATNKDFSLVACAGRQVFKVYSIEEDRFTDKHNLRPPQRAGLNYVAVDVVWSPREESVLASASSNGSVVFWDLNKSTKDKKDHVSNLHERAASRICYHSQEHLLLTGGKDGMCKLFDTRSREVSCSFSSVSVHDVQWWPSQFFLFASATENGSIQIWDYRYPPSCLLEFPAHSGPVFALDFHPEEKSKLASGGRDKLIKVWNIPVTPSPSTPQHSVTQPYSVQTIAPVSRVKWRPKRPSQIASIVNSFDLGVNVWELTRPAIPLATFTEHSEVVTSVIWKDHHEFISGGKDSKLVMHSFKDAVRLYEKANPIALSVNKGDQLALAINERLLLSSLTGTKGSSTPSSNPSHASAGSKVLTFIKGSAKGPDKRELFIKDKVSNLFFFEPVGEQGFDSQWFKYCASNYVLYGKSFDDMCQHNSGVAASRQQVQIMKHWLLLKILFSSCFDPPAFSTANLAHSMPIPERPVTLLARPEVNNTTVDLQISSYNHHNQDNGDFTSGLSDEDSDERFQSIVQNPNHDFYFEDHAINLFEFEIDDKYDDQYEDEADFELPAESFMPSHALADTADPQNTDAYHPHHQHMYNVESYQRDKHSEQRSPEKIAVTAAAFDVPMWDSVSSVISLLHSYADSGDVQTAVCMYIVLGAKVRSHIDEEVLEGWMTAYIDLLEMFKLWCESNIIITKCNVKAIMRMNQASTTVYTVCAQCHKALSIGLNGWYCKRCKELTCLCSVCHTPVKGIYAYCQGCAHGGHICHMKDWFTSNKQCPTGCGHECEWT